jgi:SEC-C motif
MSKVGRNDPCACGSGLKYKKCCLAKDEKARSAAAATKAHGAGAAATQLMQQSEKPKAPADPLVEARNARDLEFGKADYAGRIELFERSLAEPGLMDAEMAFSMLTELFIATAERGERHRYEGWVEALRTICPEVYAKEAVYLRANQVSNAIALGRDEAVHAYALELAGRAWDQFDHWRHIESQLAFYGCSQTLRAAMHTAWPKVRETENIFPWARDVFANRAIQYEILEFIEHTPMPSGDDPRLLEQVKFYWPDGVDTERLVTVVAWQAGLLARRWREEDFVPRRVQKPSRGVWDDDEGDEEGNMVGDESAEMDPAVLNILDLMAQFVGYAHRVEGRPFSRAELARGEIHSFLIQRQDGGLEYRENMLDTAMREAGRKRGKIKRFKPYANRLCPDYERLDRYVAGLLNGFDVDPYAVVALLDAVPVWVRFLHAYGLLDAEICRNALQELQPLAGHVLRIFRERRFDPAAYEALRKCIEDGGAAGSTQNTGQHGLAPPVAAGIT